MSSYKCQKCNNPTFHDEQWDSYFCAICNFWNESKCGADDCSYCVNRPDKPLNEPVHDIYLLMYKELGFKAVEEGVNNFHNE